MRRPTHIEIDGKKIAWRDLLELRREQLRAAAQVTQPELFEMHDDRRPEYETTAASRYREPSLFERLTQG